MRPGIAQDSELLKRLPELFKELRSELPFSDLMNLVEKFGGTRVYIPRRPTKDSAVASVLAPQSFQALCRQRGGDQILIPRAAALRRAIRDQAVLAALRQGKTYREVALAFDMTQRNVYRIAKVGAGHSTKDSTT